MQAEALARSEAASAGRPTVFLEVGMGGQPVGRVTIQLFSDVVPRTAENFRALCTGEKGLGFAGKPLHYKGCALHRVVPNAVIQGGDITKGNGTGGESVYGSTFDDEGGFMLSHSERGLLSMANNGPNSNSSQFLIVLRARPELDRKHVVFGRVMSGMSVIDRVEAACGVADEGGRGCAARGGSMDPGVLAFRPTKRAWIMDCGLATAASNGLSAIEDDCKNEDNGHRPAKRGRTASPRDPEAAQFSHILLTHQESRLPATWQGKAGSGARTRGKARLAAESLQKRLMASCNLATAFADAARDHSEEVVSAQRGGDLGEAKRGAKTWAAPELEDAAFTLQAGELSEVHESAWGFHLVLRAL